jgi:acylphosphatase
METTPRETTRLHAVVRGIVQGVGYRWFVIRAARSMELTGFARNLRDGGVEVVAEGTREELERFLGMLYEGPRASAVRDVEVGWTEATGEYYVFDVLI